MSYKKVIKVGPWILKNNYYNDVQVFQDLVIKFKIINKSQLRICSCMCLCSYDL